VKLLAGLMLVGAATPAHAEWQGFEWGMTEAQVEAARSEIAVYRLETAKPRKTYPSVSTLGGVWSKDGHEYQLYFYFDADGKLRDIDVEPVSVECSNQNAVFSDRFGKFEEEVSQLGSAERIVRRWRLGKAAELVTTVLHFPSNDQWICKALIKEPVDS